MSDLRRKTNPDRNSDLFHEHKGFTKNCMTCNQWKSPLGWRKHPFRNYTECAQCVEKRGTSSEP